MVEVEIKRGLGKMPIFVDDSDIYTDLEVAALFAKHNIVLLGLIPFAKSKMRLLDVTFFSILKGMLRSVADAHGLSREYSTVAGIFKLCADKLQAISNRK